MALQRSATRGYPLYAWEKGKKEGRDKRDYIVRGTMGCHAWHRVARPQSRKGHMAENPRFGSSFDDWLKEQGLYEGATEHAIERIFGWLDYHVEWSPENREFVATCWKFPSLSYFAATEFEALRGIRALVADVTEREDE